MRVISFSLWGNKPKYNVGAIRNAELASQVYPGWRTRFYASALTDGGTLEQLRRLGADVRVMPEQGDWTAALWRFHAAGDPDVEVMISRDCDCRIGEREAEAVGQWLNSAYGFHIMRDHPLHGAPILGGMWGVKAPLLSDLSLSIAAFLEQWRLTPAYGIDQEFLRGLYPLIKDDAMVHDDFFEHKPWPSPRHGWTFVGQVFNEDESTPARDLNMIRYMSMRDRPAAENRVT